MYLPSTNTGARSESCGFTAASTSGIAITPSTTTSTYGSYTTIIASTAFTYESLLVMLYRTGNATDYCFDIAIGAAASEWNIVKDLRLSCRTSASGAANRFMLPLHVPSGSRISARCQAGGASQSATDISLIGFSSGVGGAPGFSRCEHLGSLTTSRGITLDPSTANTKTAYTQVNASTAGCYKAVMVQVGGAGDIARTTNSNVLFDLAIGAAASEANVLPNYPIGTFAFVWEEPVHNVMGPFALNIPEASRVSMRCQASDVTAGDRTLDFCVYGFF